MSWVINTITKILLGIITSLFLGLAGSFIKIFGINIGATFPTVEKSMTLAQVLKSYGKGTSVFDILFPMKAFKTIFAGIALTIATGLLVLELVKAISAPMTGGRKQHPASSVAKYAIAIPGIYLSYRIMVVLEYIGQQFYIQFAKACLKGVGKTNPAALPGMLAGKGGGGLSNVLNFASGIADLYSTATPAAPIVGIAAVIFNLFIVWLVFANFFRLMLEIMERYVVMGVLFYTAPLPFAALASDETSHIFSSWIKMVLSQMFLMMTNGMFIYVFLSGLARLSVSGNNTLKSNVTAVLSGFGIGAQLQWAIYMFLLIGWLLLAQRFDSYLNSLGLSTAQTGGGLVSAVRSGAIAVGGAAAGLSRAYNNSAAKKNITAAKPGVDGLKTNASELGRAVKRGAQSAFTGSSDNRAQTKANAEGAIQRHLQQNDRGLYKNYAENGHKLEGNDAKRAMSQMTDDKNLKSLIDKGSDHKLDKNIASFNDENGKKFSYALGDKDAFGEGNSSAIGEQAGMPVFASGSAASMDKILSQDGKSVTQSASESMAAQLGAGYEAGTVDGVHGVKNKMNNSFSPVAPSGSTDVSGSDLGNGFVMGSAMPSAGFTSYGHDAKVEQNKNSLYGNLSSNEISALSTPGTNLSGSGLAGAIGASPKFGAVMGASRSVVSGGDGLVSIGSYGGGSISLDLFNPDAIGNSTGGQGVARVTDYGKDNATGIAFYNAQSGIEKSADKLSSYFSSNLNMGEGGDDVRVLKPSEYATLPGTNDLCSMMTAIVSGDDVLAEMTYSGLTENMGEGWVNGSDGISFRLTDEGRKHMDEPVAFEVLHAARGDEVFKGTSYDHGVKLTHAARGDDVFKDTHYGHGDDQ